MIRKQISSTLPPCSPVKRGIVHIIRKQISSTLLPFSPVKSYTPSDICECKQGTYHYLFECLLVSPQRVTLAVNVIGILQNNKLDNLTVAQWLGASNMFVS